MNKADFANKVVIITGASGNLGQATASALETAGAHLVLVDLSAEGLNQLFPRLAESKSHFLAAPVDVTDAEAMKATAGEAVKRFGRIDALINTVGGYRAGTPLHETPAETWEVMMNLNARSVFVACQAVIPWMLEQGSGKIVNIAARAGVSGGANMAAYSASKSAVIRLTESMAAELRHDGINVNCILPGTIDTPQNRQAMPSADHSRWVAPEAIAEVILFLVSPSASAIHGAAIPVYGRS